MNILDRFMDRVAVVTGDKSGHNYGPPGSKFTIKRCTGSSNTVFRGIREIDGQSGNDIHACDFDIDPKQLISGTPESKMEKFSKWEENPDEYKNLSVIEIKGEDTIYLSSALRSNLRVKEGDKIVFAIDNKRGKKTIYISKDNADGDEINNVGEIKTFANCRVLMRELGQNILFVDFTPTYNEDFPDLTFYRIGTKAFEIFNYAENLPKIKFNSSMPGYLETADKKSIPKTAKVKMTNQLTDYNSLDDNTGRITLKWNNSSNQVIKMEEMPQEAPDF